jgi:hypothetical protein
MKNGNSEHDFDSIARRLRRQDAMLKVLLRHLAHAEATLSVVMVKTLPGKGFCAAKTMRDFLQAKIYREMIAEIKRKHDDLWFA